MVAAVLQNDACDYDDNDYYYDDTTTTTTTTTKPLWKTYFR